MRGELARVFGVCGTCRACIGLCGAFPTLFDLLDRTAQADAGLQTPAEQDAVVDQCFHCNRCAVDCPYSPGRHAAAVDVPRLMLRARAMRRAAHQVSLVDGLTAARRARTDAFRLLAGDAPPPRWSPTRLVPPRAKQRFSGWFDRHSPTLGRAPRGTVVVYPTCLVEYQATDVGRDLVAVLEQSGIECSRSRGGCCGAPWLHAGDRRRFTKMANDTVRRLAAELRTSAAEAVVVPEPTCRSVIEREYAAAVDPQLRDDAAFVVDRLASPSAYLVAVHDREGEAVGATFPAVRGLSVVFHSACHAGPGGSASSDVDLLRRCGADVTVVEGCAGVGGRWGAASDDASARRRLADHLADDLCRHVDGSPTESNRSTAVVVGGCSVANRTVAAHGGGEVVDVMALLARRFQFSGESPSAM